MEPASQKPVLAGIRFPGGGLWRDLPAARPAARSRTVTEVTTEGRSDARPLLAKHRGKRQPAALPSGPTRPSRTHHAANITAILSCMSRTSGPASSPSSISARTSRSASSCSRCLSFASARRGTLVPGIRVLFRGVPFHQLQQVARDRKAAPVRVAANHLPIRVRRRDRDCACSACAPSADAASVSRRHAPAQGRRSRSAG